MTNAFKMNNIQYQAINLKTISRGVLADEARGEGYRFIDRLYDEGALGHNCFDKAGECLFGAFDHIELVGICGLNRDPYIDASIGRLRHLYVCKDYRCKGIARNLIGTILKGFPIHFERIRLRVSDQAAAGFYERFGFSVISEGQATHSLSYYNELRF